MSEVIAIFDIGKTNKKILLFNDEFKVVYQHEEKFPVTSDDDGFECDDIDLITSWIRETLEKISSDYHVKGVNFSTYGASLMFLDEQGKRLTPVYNYLKEVPSSIQDSLFQKYGGKDEFSRKAASPALGLLLNSGVQILWLKELKNEIFSRSETILHFPQYLSFCLTNKIVSEPTSIGCHTFLWDFDQMNYHQWLADQRIKLPEPINNDITFSVNINGEDIQVGTGIHDSSASLVPYLKGSKEKFILVSTGTWCINMNPFNKEPLTANQLEQDCLCFLTPEKAQVKSSRLFMGHFHEVWAEKLSNHFNVAADQFKSVNHDEGLLEQFQNEIPEAVYFPDGKESFETGLKLVDLNMFASYEEAYTKLMIDLTELCVTSIRLVIPDNDETTVLYVSGGFARNPIFINLLNKSFNDKNVLVSEIDNSSALGAAMVISDTLTKPAQLTDLGIIK